MVEGAKGGANVAQRWRACLGMSTAVVVASCVAGCYTGLSFEDTAGGAETGGQDGGTGAEESGGTQGGGSEELCLEPQVGPTDLRRLTAAQYDNTIRDLFGADLNASAEFAPDERVGPFKSNSSAPVVELQVEQYMDAAEAVAEYAVGDLGALLPCDPTAMGEEACAETFVREFGPRALRRPLTEEYIDRLMAVYAEGRAQADFANGIRVLIAGILQSPYFLYHVEFGTEPAEPGSEVVPLTDYELASRLSYFLWNTMPDAELFAAAQAGELGSEEGLAAQVDRMLSDPRMADAVENFHVQWLGVDEIESVEKDLSVYPQYDEALAAAMKAETADFARHVVLEGDASLTTLLTGDFTVTDDPALLALYGVSLPEGHQAGDLVPLPAGERAGLLTQAGVMASLAHANQTSPIHRGVMVRANILCQPLPPPPPDVDDVPPDPDPNATTRERFEQHNSDPKCAGCHQMIDPIGFGFEHYDGVGAYRLTEGELPIDASGRLIATDVDGEFEGAVELAQMLSRSEQVQQCFARQWFRYAFGRNETDSDECSTRDLELTFAESEGDVLILLRALITSDAFRYRRAQESDQ